MSIAGILLAAGQGRRFGGNKCLAPLSDGVPMGLQAAQNLRLAVDSVVCVVRPDDEALKALFHQHGFDTINSPDAAKGMSASLKAGVNATLAAEGWLIALADMPLIQPVTHQYLVDYWKDKGGIVRPSCLGKVGHPVLFAQKYRDDLLDLAGDQGAKSLLMDYSSEVNVLSVGDCGVLQDFDTRIALENGRV